MRRRARRFPWQKVGPGAFLLLSCVATAALLYPAVLQKPGTGPSPSGQGLVGMEACRPCHLERYESFQRTAHARTSQPATSSTILGSFDPSQSVLQTRNSDVFFRMEKRDGGLYQTAYVREGGGFRSRRERFDLVLGSGRKGQTYLYWKEEFLYQLPVSYLVATDRWVNSPGIPDGMVLFDRPVLPRCLECHATYFSVEQQGDRLRYGRQYTLGITCEKCHGPGRRHVEEAAGGAAAGTAGAILNPARFSRQRQMDACALCHSGAREGRAPAFTYLPGQPLDEYLFPETAGQVSRIDVHGNQVGLLAASRCFAGSEMTCSTCHDVHWEERDPETLSRKCRDCHEAVQCRVVAEHGTRLASRCVDCHMPEQGSELVRVDEARRKLSVLYRNHRIAIYPGESERVLGALK